MKNILTYIIGIVVLASCSTNKNIQTTNTLIINDELVNVSDTSGVSEKSIHVFTDTSYVVEPKLTLYKELIYSEGDTTFINEFELIIVDGVEYVSPDTATWVNYKFVEVFK